MEEPCDDFQMPPDMVEDLNEIARAARMRELKKQIRERLEIFDVEAERMRREVADKSVDERLAVTLHIADMWRKLSDQIIHDKAAIRRE